MTTMTIDFVATQRVTRPANVLRMGRHLMGKLRAALDVTPQDRANRYVAMTPIAVLAA